MEPRLDYFAAAPEVMKAMLGLERAVVTSGLEKGLIELVKTRASQINGCAYCIDMHTRDALKGGENSDPPLSARRLARGAVLYAAGARGARLDRRTDPDFRNPCAG